MATPGGKKRPTVNRGEDLIGIQARRDAVLARYQHFKQGAEQRRSKLEQAKQLQQFRRDADELEAWVKEKLQIASDEAYKDRRNLQVGQYSREPAQPRRKFFFFTTGFRPPKKKTTKNERRRDLFTRLRRKKKKKRAEAGLVMVQLVHVDRRVCFEV